MILKNIKWITWLYLLVLLLGMVLPINNGETLNNIYIIEVRSDYFIHMLIMLPLATLLGLSLRNKTFRWLKIFLFGVLIVAFCEAIQLAIPYRAFNINDMLANGVGAIIGLIPAGFVWRRFSGSA